MHRHKLFQSILSQKDRDRKTAHLALLCITVVQDLAQPMLYRQYTWIASTYSLAFPHGLGNTIVAKRHFMMTCSYVVKLVTGR